MHGLLSWKRSANCCYRGGYVFKRSNILDCMRPLLGGNGSVHGGPSPMRQLPKRDLFKRDGFQSVQSLCGRQVSRLDRPDIRCLMCQLRLGQVLLQRRREHLFGVQRREFSNAHRPVQVRRVHCGVSAGADGPDDVCLVPWGRFNPSPEAQRAVRAKTGSSPRPTRAPSAACAQRGSLLVSEVRLRRLAPTACWGHTIRVSGWRIVWRAPRARHALLLGGACARTARRARLLRWRCRPRRASLARRGRIKERPCRQCVSSAWQADTKVSRGNPPVHFAPQVGLRAGQMPVFALPAPRESSRPGAAFPCAWTARWGVFRPRRMPACARPAVLERTPPLRG